MNAKTLLQRRVEQLDSIIEDLLDRAETLRKCVEGGYSDVNDRVRDLASAAFGATIEIDTLVTYAMKRDSGMVYPVCRIVGKAPTGWALVEFEPVWLKEFNAPWPARRSSDSTSIRRSSTKRQSGSTVAPASGSSTTPTAPST